MPKATSKTKAAAKKSDVEQLNETGKRKKDRRVKEEPVANERRKVQRRRQIDPTTCERDYNNDEIEFMHALDHYKRTSGRMFPTCSEILEVLMKLGYRKVELGDESPAEPESLDVPIEGLDAQSADFDSDILLAGTDLTATQEPTNC